MEAEQTELSLDICVGSGWRTGRLCTVAKEPPPPLSGGLCARDRLMTAASPHHVNLRLHNNAWRP